MRPYVAAVAALVSKRLATKAACFSWRSITAFMINLHSAILLARKIYDSRLAGGPEDARASGARMNADNARNRVRLMANEH